MDRRCSFGTLYCALKVMVCGTDGFVEAWAGGIVRTRNADGTKTKLQGPIDGSVMRQRVL